MKYFTCRNSTTIADACQAKKPFALIQKAKGFKNRSLFTKSCLVTVKK